MYFIVTSVGDRIISVNGETLDNLEYGEAIGILRSAGRVVALKLTKCIPGCLPAYGTAAR